MKHKLLTFALMGAFASSMLFSCKNAEEPIPSPGDNNSGEMVEYSISVNIPEEMRTRAASTATFDETGLYNFPLRTIDKLWYAMYYDGELEKYGTTTRNSENPFSISIRLDGDTDPSKLTFFFWAGNQGDKIGENKKELWLENYYFVLDYDNKKVITSPQLLNGVVTGSSYPIVYNNESPAAFDSFTGYFQFASENDRSIRSASFLLKRPFAQVHILTDDFLPETSDLYKDYQINGAITLAGLGSQICNYDNYQDQFKMPNVWYYEKNETLNLEKDYLSFTSPITMGFQNKLDGIKRTTFKGRTMDYLHCFWLFAPMDKLSLKDDETNLDKLNFAITTSTMTPWHVNNKYISVQLPEEGIKANHKYIIYNKSREDGGSGFLDGFFDYEILVNHDGIWESSNHEGEVDRL